MSEADSWQILVTEGDLDCLLRRIVGETRDGTIVEAKLNDDEVPLVIDVIDAFHNGAREHKQQIFKVGIQFSAWSS